MQTFTDVVCPGCACVCDDLSLTVDGDRPMRVEPPCALAERWFHENARQDAPAVEVDGRAATLDEGLERAAEILRRANYPLVYGLSRSSTPGQRAAVDLADRIGAVIDTTASLCHGPSIIALQTVGESTCTLGEVLNRSDLVVFWGCNPSATHPRHAERYSAFPRGQFVPAGRSGRTVVMIGDETLVGDWRLDPDGSLPDEVVRVAPGRDFETLHAMRALVRGLPLSATSRDAVGADFRQLQSLVERMKNCRCGVFFFGLGLAGTSLDHAESNTQLGHANVESLLRLTAELNRFARFYARRMRLQGDVSGADSVLCWRTGFPFSVDLARGYPRYNPGEYSANALLEREEPDACLLVGAETTTAFSERARRRLQSIPTVVLDYPAAKPGFRPTVHFTTSPYGLAAPGTIYRMDETPLPLRRYVDRPYPTDEQVLRDLSTRLTSVKKFGCR